MQFSDSDSNTNTTPSTVDNSGDAVTRADFDTLKSRVEDLETAYVDTAGDGKQDNGDDSFGGLTLAEAVTELQDAVFGKGVRPVRPGQFDTPTTDSGK